MKKVKLSWFFALLCSLISPLSAQQTIEFSTAGFFELPNSGRTVYSMNPAWRFFKGECPGAELMKYNDNDWEVVSVPHGIEYLPLDASGCANYQGEIWYRKHFNLDSSFLNKKLFLHFEAIMGKSKVFINGALVKEQYGGYLPIIIDVTPYVNLEGENVIAVWADNSDDPNYPPGKPQAALDFTYFGGIYRDVWLVTHNQTYITDPNYVDKEAGGGLFVSYDNISSKSADVKAILDIANENSIDFRGKAVFLLKDAEGKKVLSKTTPLRISPSGNQVAGIDFKVKNPSLWSPENPYLYNLEITLVNNKGIVVDGYRKKIGIRSIEFKGKDGFWLNGEPYPNPLIGANRHQDYAIVGNAVSNNAHWRDAKKLRDVGLKVIRNAHYPQDPSFMDACDQLGLFVIVNTPGWQFWNEAPEFEQRVYSDIRNMVRRDRNHTSVWLWEPILNETWYPDYFAKNVKELVEKEYPYNYCYTASDESARGSEYFPIQFGHPQNADKEWALDKLDSTKTYYTREWGDNVDDWSSHNSNSRVARNWGEVPMLVQAQHYASPNYPYTAFNTLYQTTRQHVGGCLWHSFDHQRGYHPEPFYGGIMDAFRQPKYSYFLFKAQRDPYEVLENAESGPMIHIAHEMTPFSPADVTVYSNCDEVHLKFTKDGEDHIYRKEIKQGLPSPIIVFKDVYDFMVDKNLSRKGKSADSYLLAEGYLDGKLVATDTVYPSRRPSHLRLWIDDQGTELRADGSDFVTVIAAVTDQKGNIKRLSNEYIYFEVEGEGELIGGNAINANPVRVQWGTAPILLRSTVKAGEIKIKARVQFEGYQKPMQTELIINSVKPSEELLYDEAEMLVYGKINQQSIPPTVKRTLSEKERTALLQEVERQQEEFGEKNNN